MKLRQSQLPIQVWIRAAGVTNYVMLSLHAVNTPSATLLIVVRCLFQNSDVGLYACGNFIEQCKGKGTHKKMSLSNINNIEWQLRNKVYTMEIILHDSGIISSNYSKWNPELRLDLLWPPSLFHMNVPQLQICSVTHRFLKKFLWWAIAVPTAYSPISTTPLMKGNQAHVSPPFSYILQLAATCAELISASENSTRQLQVFPHTYTNTIVSAA